MDTEIGPLGGTQDAFYARPLPVRLPMMVRGEGIRLWDEAGKEYIDSSSGPMVSALGHCNPNVVAAMTRQAGRLDYAFTLVARNPVNQHYTERLAKLAGPGFERVNLTSGGSEAVDHALKLVRQLAIVGGEASRRRIISLNPSYHGATIASLAAGGNDLLLPFFDGFAVTAETIPAPFSYRLPKGVTPEMSALASARALEAKIVELGPETVLAFIIEAVGGLSTGAVVPPPEYFRSVRDICTRYGVKLIFDEVLCGAGRTGKFFAAHHWPEALPDIIVQAKGLGAGYAPIGALLAPASDIDRLAAAAGFNFTYSYNANPIACAAGLAVLDEIERHDLCRNAELRGAELRAGLEALKHTSPLVGDVRGLGLLLAVELVADQASRQPMPRGFRALDRLRHHGLEEGIMLYARETAGGRFGQWIMIAPPLNVTSEEIALILSRLQRSLARLGGDALAHKVLLQET